LYNKSKCHGTKPMHPSLSRAFQRHQEHDLKHPGSVDLITTKQNKLPSFIDRYLEGFWFLWEDFRKIIFLHGEIFEFPWFFFCLKVHVNVNSKATVWHNLCFVCQVENSQTTAPLVATCHKIVMIYFCGCVTIIFLKIKNLYILLLFFVFILSVSQDCD